LIASALLPPTWGWSLLFLFSGLWIGLGMLWGGRAASLDGYMLANRNVGIALGAATAVATWITSNTTMLAPQFALQMGMWGMIAYSTAAIGLLLFAPMAERIRKLMPHGYTSAEFVRLRYGNKAWTAFLVISIFYSLTWMVSMGMAGGMLLEALSDIPYVYGMSVILFVCVTYTLFGGLFAVIGTDFIQSLVILIGVVVVAVAVLSQVSLTEVYEITKTERPELLNILFPAAIMAFFNNLLFGLGEVFHSNVWWARAFAMRPGVGKRAYVLAAVIWLPIPIAAGFLALAAPALGINILRPDMVGPVVAGTVAGQIGSVIVFVLVFSSIASSIDSLLAATSQLITIDIYKQLVRPQASSEQMRKVAARIIVVMGLFTWLVCLPKIGNLATVLFFAGPLVGSTTWPILAGLYWRQTNRMGATFALVSGSILGLWAYFQIGWYTGALVGTGVSFLITAISTWLAPNDYQWSLLNPDVQEGRNTSAHQPS